MKDNLSANIQARLYGAVTFDPGVERLAVDQHAPPLGVALEAPFPDAALKGPDREPAVFGRALWIEVFRLNMDTHDWGLAIAAGSVYQDDILTAICHGCFTMRINLTVELSEDHMASIREAAVEGRYPSITVQAKTFNPILAPPWKDDLLPPRWLSIQGARRYTGLSDTTLRKACGHGLIKSYFARTQGMGAGKRLLDRLSIDDWIESGTPGAERFRYEEPGKRKRQAETRAMIKANKERWAKDPQK